MCVRVNVGRAPRRGSGAEKRIKMRISKTTFKDDDCKIKVFSDKPVSAHGWESGDGLGLLTLTIYESKNTHLTVKLTEEDFNKIYKYAVDKQFIKKVVSNG